MQPIPKKVDPFSATEMLIEWNTGERFAVPYVELRYYCPCAGCVDEHTGKRTLSKSSISPEIRPMDAQPVGRYALNLQWNDGHKTGIYHFDTLYEISLKQGRKI